MLFSSVSIMIVFVFTRTVVADFRDHPWLNSINPSEWFCDEYVAKFADVNKFCALQVKLRLLKIPTFFE